jgi:hypothetical protein
VICEIKQIQPNAADLEDLRDVDVAVGRFVPNRFRSKLKDSAQLKAAADSGVPTLLVVYDNTPFKMYSANFEVLQALFGVESVVVRVPKQSGDEMLVSPSFFAGNRGLTPDQNTSVSAVAILEEDGPESDLRLRVYHNPYASVVLAPHLLRILPVAERVMPGDKTVSL